MSYIIDSKKIETFKRKRKVKTLLNRLHDLDTKNEWQLADAEYFLTELSASEIALMQLLFTNEKGAKHLPYITARASETLMFESCYMSSVLGKQPYLHAINFGLRKADIEEYQQKWREMGIEPFEVRES